MTRNTTSKRILATRTQQLPVQLSEPEIREAGKRLAQLEGELARHGQKEKEIREQLRGERSTMEGKLSALAAIIRQGYEHRPIPVRVEADYREGKVYEIREDTGEVVADRPVNEQDRQIPLLGGQPTEAPVSEKAREARAGRPRGPGRRGAQERWRRRAAPRRSSRAPPRSS